MIIVFILYITIFATFAENNKIILGAERFAEYLPKMQNKRVAFCGNQSSQINGKHLVDILLEKKVNLVQIFCPEHGFRGRAEAGAVIENEIDEKTNLPIISLYGKDDYNVKAKDLQNIDIILFDIQDVGVRFYTYTATLHYLMEAAAENEKKVIVLDRPNPNGHYVDGPVWGRQGKNHLVGMHPVPVVHGFTIGEYAKFLNGEKLLANKKTCDLDVVVMQNYNHKKRYDLPIPPSPNIKNMHAVYLYPNLCLFEGTQISLGRGTENPFQIFGASGLNIGDFYFTPQPIKGVAENPPQNGEKCRGFDLTRISPPQKFDLSFLILAYNNFSNKEKFFLEGLFFDDLAGGETLRKQIIAGLSEEEIRKTWQKDLEEFKNVTRKKYLIYED